MSSAASSYSQQTYNSPNRLRKFAAPKPILTNKQTGAFKIHKDGQDVTPEPLNPQRPEIAVGKEGGRVSRISVFSLSGERNKSTQSVTDIKVFQTQSISRFQTELYKQTIEAQSRYQQSYISSEYIDDVIIEPERKDSISGSLVVVEDDEQLGIVPGEEIHPKAMPTHISLILTETPTFFLLDLPSKSVEKNTPEAAAVEDDNARYEYLTRGKGRNRKMVNAEVQTTQILKKTRFTEAERAKRRHNHTFASNWEMFDTYNIQKQEKLGTFKKEFLDEEVVDEDILPQKKTQKIPFTELQMNRLMKNEKFLQAVCVIERLLANNNYNEQQKRFRGLSDPDPFRENIQYEYRLDLLWTFANKETADRCVSAMCWNPINPDVLAVGYGKFYYTDVAKGLILIWNIKNPVQPERTYRFEEPVTSMNFSIQNPNVLGVGFYNGIVRLLDVSAREPRIVGKSFVDSPMFEPIWQIVFYKGSDYFKDEEHIITVCQDGRISYFRQQDTLELNYSQIMRVTRPEGKLKGLSTLRRCHVPGIPITRYAAALAIQQHPADPNIYYVGTNEGTIHKCSRNYYHQHLDLFLAHDGPIYLMKFSPFCNKLFLTCGDDWHVRIWADGIAEPLFELSRGAMLSVQSADWSPTHSTMLASISGGDISLWDLQRKTYKPQSVTTSPTNSRNTIVQFTQSGRCLAVGDIDGNVHVFALEDMPFPAFFQDDLLSTAIIRGLITRPDLVRQLKKLGSLNFDKKKFEKYFS